MIAQVVQFSWTAWQESVRCCMFADISITLAVLSESNGVQRSEVPMASMTMASSSLPSFGRILVKAIRSFRFLILLQDLERHWSTLAVRSARAA